MFPALVDTVWGPIGVTAASVFGAAVPVTAVVADQQKRPDRPRLGPPGPQDHLGNLGDFDLATRDAAFTFPGPRRPAGCWSPRPAARRQWCVEGGWCSPPAAALDWLRRTLRPGVVTAVASRPWRRQAPDAAGAAFLPALQGLGAPHGDLDPARRPHRPDQRSRAARSWRAPGWRDCVPGGGRWWSTSTACSARRRRGNPRRRRRADDQTASSCRCSPTCWGGGAPACVAEATLLGAAMCAGRGAGLLTEADAAALVRFQPPVTPASAPTSPRSGLPPGARRSTAEARPRRPAMQTVTLGPSRRTSSRLTWRRRARAAVGERRWTRRSPPSRGGGRRRHPDRHLRRSYRDLRAAIGRRAFQGAPPLTYGSTQAPSSASRPLATRPAWRPPSTSSLAAMRVPAPTLSSASNIRPDDYAYARFDEPAAAFATPGASMWTRCPGDGGLKRRPDRRLGITSAFRAMILAALRP